ncbi:hypothetical protein ACFVH9_08370 [Streptomyces hirsutus]|uniref:hypothetical protein n=1 Tax=Streptomyces hirsutus TaxID=35620 RepID=UPI00364520B5
MNASLTQTLTHRANLVLNTEKAARATLAETLADFTKGVDPSAMRRVAEAAAQALPYRMLLEDAEIVGFEKALTTLRKRLIAQLLTRSPGSSTCQFTNEASRLEIEGIQSFLGGTSGLVED